MKLLSDAVWRTLADELEAKRFDLRKANERIDRLTEAVAKRNDLQIVMPQTQLPQVYAAPSKEIEKGSGWFDTRPAVPPVAPKSGGSKQ